MPNLKIASNTLIIIVIAIYLLQFLTTATADNIGVYPSWKQDRDKNIFDINKDADLHWVANDTERVNLYINFKTPPTALDINILRDLGVNISYNAKFIPTVCAREVPKWMIPEIKKLDNIDSIEQQPYLVPLLDVSARAIKARESEEYSPEAAWELGYTGRNINIAILDTGVDDRHESLINKYIMGYDCTLRVPRETNPDDEDGHGTHCAGIAMGTGGEDGQYIGIAPNAKLLDVKVLNDIGLTPGDQIVMGIEWCINQKDEYDIDILSISIGELFRGNDDGSGTHANLINTAANAGLIVIVAGGNDGPNNNGFSSLAAADGAITVGAIDEKETTLRTDDDIASFSNRGPRASDGDNDELDELKPDVVAPGVSIMSAFYSNTQVGLITGYQQMSGTSMACPHVAGLAALLLEAKPDLSPDEVKQIIKDTAEPRGHPSYPDLDPKYNVDYGCGIVDAYEAVRKVVGEDYQTVNVQSHDSFDKVYNLVTISGTAEVNKGRIQKVEYNINEGPWGTAAGQDEWSFAWDTRTVVNGLNTVYVRSFDGIEYSKDYELILNVVNIGCEILDPVNGTKVKGTLYITGFSFGEDISKVQIQIIEEETQLDPSYWEDVSPTSGTGNYSTWEYIWETKSDKNGIYELFVRAYNGEWYSIPTSIEVNVNNEKSNTNTSIPGFDSLAILSTLVIFIIFLRKRKYFN